MSTAAIVMMIVALLAVWGGLGLALLNLRRHPEDKSDDADDAGPAQGGGAATDAGSGRPGTPSPGAGPPASSGPQ